MQDRKTPDRRTLLAGAATAGAAATAVALLPSQPAPAVAVNRVDVPAAEPAPGYRLTEHVKRYYATARI